jgi:hypothetical protein
MPDEKLDPIIESIIRSKQRASVAYLVHSVVFLVFMISAGIIGLQGDNEKLLMLTGASLVGFVFCIICSLRYRTQARRRRQRI